MRVEAALLCFKEQETRGAAGVGQVPGVVLLAMGDKACRTLCVILTQRCADAARRALGFA